MNELLKNLANARGAAPFEASGWEEERMAGATELLVKHFRSETNDCLEVLLGNRYLGTLLPENRGPEFARVSRDPGYWGSKRNVKVTYFHVTAKGSRVVKAEELRKLASGWLAASEEVPGAEELERRIKGHDWYHAMSDDGSVHRRGRANFARLKELAEELPELANKLWDEHAPEEFVRPLVDPKPEPSFTPVVKTGRCANGSERDRGRVVHLVRGSRTGDCWFAKALCGTEPGRLSAGWSEAMTEAEVTCPRCLKRAACRKS